MSASVARAPWRQVALAYALLWSATFTAALIVIPFRSPVRSLLRLRMAPTPPQLGDALTIALHNLRVAAIPLLLAVAGAGQHRRLRIAGDLIVASSLVANAALGGLALGAYGDRIVAYLPHMPAEWAGLAAGAASWLLARERPPKRAELLGLTATCGVTLLIGALLETYATPQAY